MLEDGIAMRPMIVQKKRFTVSLFQNIEITLHLSMVQEGRIIVHLIITELIGLQCIQLWYRKIWDYNLQRSVETYINDQLYCSHHGLLMRAKKKSFIKLIKGC